MSRNTLAAHPLTYERLSSLPMTVTPLKPKTPEGYVIQKRQASKNPASVSHRNVGNDALQYLKIYTKRFQPEAIDGLVNRRSKYKFMYFSRICYTEKAQDISGYLTRGFLVKYARIPLVLDSEPDMKSASARRWRRAEKLLENAPVGVPGPFLLWSICRLDGFRRT